MKQRRYFWRCSLILLLILSMLLSACQSGDSADGTDTGGAATNAPGTTSPVTQAPETPKLGYLPSGTAISTLVCGDGMNVEQYENQSEADYAAACLYFEEDGYLEYCSRDTENTRSATYVKGDAYSTLFYRKGWKNLYVGTAQKGARDFPPRNGSYSKTCETTITQPGLSQDGGMCEIFRLADGSFLIFDAGNPPECNIIYNELCRLNGSAENIRIRAWVLTHAHGDHYGGFKVFAPMYGQRVQIDYVLYSPLAVQEWDTMDSYNVSWNTIDYYFNGNLQALIRQYLPDTVLCAVHGGQTFTFADVVLEVLYSPEFVYIDSVPVDANNTSMVCRVVAEEGSMILMGDCGAEASQWIHRTYNEELKSDMMQVTHHGMVTEHDLKTMKRVDPTVFFWPCSEAKFNQNWGINYKGKQHAIAEAENLLHGFGSATRPLSYRGKRPTGVEVLTSSTEVEYHGVTKVQTEEGIRYLVSDASDPYVCFGVDMDTAQYNALLVTVKCPAFQKCELYWTSGSETPFVFTAANRKPLGPQGSGDNGVVTLLVYLGNGSDFTGDVTSLRIDLGTAVGQDISIYSVEAIQIDLQLQ